jgi:hypothetical protein
MAEIAIPLIALGGMYVVANSKDEKVGKEGYSGMGKPANALPGVKPPRIPVNYPTTEAVKLDNVRRYPNANQATDKYFDQTVYERVVESNPLGSAGGGAGSQVNLSLTGEPIDTSDFKHANMVPYFGGKVRGATANADAAEGTLDALQGAGSQFIRKEEIAPLFKPQRDYQFPHGSPNRSDFMMSRVNPSMKMANVKPWAEEKVPPGLGKGYNCEGGAGFNSGMEDRDSWLPKTVNQLRVDTNPKMTFGLGGHEGPAMAKVVDPASAATQGDVEKYRPDTDFRLGPERWFTTTGMEHAPTGRAIEAMPPTKRPETEVAYYGQPEAEGEAGYVGGLYRAPKKTQLAGPELGQIDAGGRQGIAAGDRDIQSYQHFGNNRGTTRQPTEFGGVQGTIRAMIAPLLDVLRPSRKEDMVGSTRVTGNPTTTVANAPIYDPADRTRTTIREMTEGSLDGVHQNIQGHSGGGAYEVSAQQAVDVQRDTTNCSYLASASPGSHGAEPDQCAASNQRNNPYKGLPNRPNQGGTQIFNQQDTICITRKSGNTCDGRLWAPHNPPVPPSIDTHGGLQAVPSNMGRGRSTIECERISPDILDAFKSNPYTQSLSSWAAP